MAAKPTSFRPVSFNIYLAGRAPWRARVHGRRELAPPPMSEAKLSRDVVVTNSQGLHFRPADLISKKAREFQAKIELVRGHERIDARSILEISTLGAVPGTMISIEAVGPDAESALEALAELFAAKFYEDQPDTP